MIAKLLTASTAILCLLPFQIQAETSKFETEGLHRLVTAQPIIFVVRQQYPGDHHNTATMFQTGEINAAKFHGPGAIKVLETATGQVRTLLDVPAGIARDLEVSFDGQKVLFSMRKEPADDYHLYEINADGTNLKQLTFGAGVTDIDPIYLPDGQILFTSTREPKYCMCNRHIMGNLFTMDADGANIQQIGHSTLHEGHASLTPDGRVLYDRWEYVDRNFGDAQGLWVVSPDGTNHAVYWGNNTNSPGAVLDVRTLPGKEQFIATFSSCHDRPWGALAIVDRRLGLDGLEPVIRTWPADAVNLIGKGNYDTFKKVNPKYEDPYPLSDSVFLCVRMTGEGEQTGIFVLDAEADTETLLYSESPGCYDPIPLAPRPQPSIIPPRIDLAQTDGYFYIADVYEGTGMEHVELGSVKYLRVVESPEKRFYTQQAWNGSGTQAPGMAFDDFNNKRIIGTVPVAEDGSVYFSVPSDTYVYFQLLDEHGMMVQSMRSGTITRPGETIGCVGCHENRRGTIPPASSLAAMRRPPSRPQPWHGPPRTFSYLTEVQPVFDRHCVSCHDYGQPAGDKLNLAGDLGLIFNTSYHELRSKQYVRVVGAGPFQVQLPKSWGSHASPLVSVLLNGHTDPAHDENIKLSDEDFDRVVTWIDINAPYYPEYASAYRNNLYGRSPINNQQLARLAELTGLALNKQNFSAQVSFTRPEFSPCLQMLRPENPPDRYQEALEIIRKGQAMLAQRPRADMANFQLVSPVEIDQQQRYATRLEKEAVMREAIANGQKQYENEP